LDAIQPVKKTNLPGLRDILQPAAKKIIALENKQQEAVIDNITYVCNYNDLFPLKDKNRENTYEKWWTPELSYDPDWLLNGTDIHMWVVCMHNDSH